LLLLCYDLTRRGWATSSVACGVVFWHNIVIGCGGRRVCSGLGCFLLMVLNSTNVVIFMLLSLFFRLAGLRGYVSGDHERLAI
jgi:hypothetical protein